jgi:hypothetical protein
MLRRDLTDPSRWWEAYAYYNSLARQAEDFLLEDPAEATSRSWNFDPNKTYGLRGSDGETHDPAAVLAMGAGELDDHHRALVPRVIADASAQLREVNACLMASAELEAVPLMWAPYKKYLQCKLSSRVAEGKRSVDNAKIFFEIAFPAFNPPSVREFGRIRSDPRVRQLREEVDRAAERGELVDPQYPQRTIAEVIHIERQVARLRRIAGWIATAVGVIPLPGIGLLASAAAEGVASALDRKKRAPLNWFYLISDGRGGS